MNFFFSSQLKIHIEDFLDFILFSIIFCLSLASFSKYNWLFNLFDQFWSQYTIVTIFLLVFFLLKKRILKSLLSIGIILFCLFVFSNLNKISVKEKISSKSLTYFQNINTSNKSFEILEDSLIDINPENIFLVEVSAAADDYLTKKLNKYKYHFSLPRNDTYGFSLFSKFKFQVLEVQERSGVPVLVKIYYEETKLTVYIVHLPPPLWGEAVEDQIETLNYISDEIIKKKSDQFLLLGDFNMTPQSKIFSNFYKKLNPKYNSLINLLMGTWPAILPKYLGLSIDHVFSNRVIDVELGESSGSDHRALLIRM